jgi:hypothetical protein
MMVVVLVVMMVYKSTQVPKGRKRKRKEEVELYEATGYIYEKALVPLTSQ